MNREKWYEVIFFTNKPQEATERLDTNFVGKIDNLKVTEIKSQIEPMNREKLEQEIFNIINASCGHKNTPLEDSCGFCRIYQRRTKDILTAIDAYVAEREKELKTKTNIAFIEITKAIGTSTQFMKKDGRRKVMQVIREFNRANIHPSATHGKGGNEQNNT